MTEIVQGLEQVQCQQDRRGIIRALVQFESSLRWLTNLRSDSDQCSQGIIAFASLNSSHSIGSLARLEIKNYGASLLEEHVDGPILVSDFIYQGFLSRERDWDDAFDDAARWAAWAANVNEVDSAKIQLYALNFCFSDPMRLRREFVRPKNIVGPSASLAAGVLARAQREARTVDAGCCYIGHIERTGNDSYQLKAVDGIGSKNRAASAGRLRGKIFLGSLTATARAEVTAWDYWPEPGQRVDVESPQQAYDYSTGRTEALREYFQSELRLVDRKLTQFTPERISRQLQQSLKEVGSETSFGCLNDLTIPQTVERKRKTSDALELFAGNNDEQEVFDLTSVIDDFLEAAEFAEIESVKCLKIIAGPGMGKTWAGLRCHLKLLGRYWRGLKHGAQENREPLFSIWTTFAEIQKWIEANPRSGLAETLTGIVVERMGLAFEPIIRQTIESHLERKSLFLILDAWDERFRKTEVTLKNWLNKYWFSNACFCVITSRTEGESNQVDDPFHELQRLSRPWRISKANNSVSFRQFAKRWFGKSFSKFNDPIADVLSNEKLDNVTSIPQIAAIICWMLQNGTQLAGAAEPASLFRGAIDKILEKSLFEQEFDCNAGRRGVRTDTEWDCYRDAISFGSMQSLLKELAFLTFDGQRWEFDLALLSQELELDNLAQILNRPGLKEIPIPSLARFILGSGLFVATPGGKFEVVHQSLAEYLVAEKLFELYPSAPEVVSYEEAERFALKFGLFDQKWRNVFQLYVYLSNDTSNLLELLYWSDGRCENEVCV